MQIVVENVHIRFEDNGVSRAAQGNPTNFNFGVTCDSISYSQTNSRFERKFISLDDRLREKRGFSMLEISQLAAYWNTEVVDNWTSSDAFSSCDEESFVLTSKNEVAE